MSRLQPQLKIGALAQQHWGNMLCQKVVSITLAGKELCHVR
ncbi:hypothetical protein PJE062_1109 [Pseudovibrio sp. JE062]|nr:hypothetical protein PJE062_1109 [Pseudovibrio sp. JE062]